ncbi:hypothetical protein [Facklamia hominis]
MLKFNVDDINRAFEEEGIIVHQITPEELSRMTIQELLSLRMIGLSDQEEKDVIAEFEKPHRKKELLEK